MAITSVDVDTEMLRLAKSAFGVTTNRDAINLALRDAVMRRRQLEAVDAIARIPLDSDAQRVPHAD